MFYSGLPLQTVNVLFMLCIGNSPGLWVVYYRHRYPPLNSLMSIFHNVRPLLSISSCGPVRRNVLDTFKISVYFLFSFLLHFTSPKSLTGPANMWTFCHVVKKKLSQFSDVSLKGQLVVQDYRKVARSDRWYGLRIVHCPIWQLLQCLTVLWLALIADLSTSAFSRLCAWAVCVCFFHGSHISCFCPWKISHLY